MRVPRIRGSPRSQSLVHINRRSSLPLALLVAVCVAPLGGCAVVSAVDTAASVAIGVAGLAADAAIGTVRLTGKAVGAAADLVLPDSAAQ
jgi:hypothetical protein